MKRQQGAVISLLALGHGLNDGLAGYLLGAYARSAEPVLQIAIGLFLYNLLAFGGQYPVALWLEKWRDHKSALLLAYGLNLLSVLLSFLHFPLSIITAGIASALYHVAGGAVCASGGKAAPVGVFAAPGVAGLIGGGYLAWAGFELRWILSIIIFLFLLVIFFLPEMKWQTEHPAAEEKERSFQPDGHDAVMILLLTVIAMRSVIWNLFQLIHDQEYTWLIAIALSAAAGKLIGGWVADRIGWRLYVLLSVGTATPLIGFFRNDLVLFCIGIGLLQSGIPASTSLLIRSVGNRAGRGVALSFGTAIIAGAVAFFTPARNILTNNALVFIFGALMVFLMLRVPSRKKPDLFPARPVTNSATEMTE